ncbi:uncharacterized protein [Trachinotus anak]|uniref:uncharacterized protein n=1 Tax=Trachinotus anak TaxID=443729 RepID=UPI0039F2622E
MSGEMSEYGLNSSTSSRVMDEEMSDMDNMADTFVSDIMGQAAMNVNELMQSIHRWASVARAMSEGKNKTSAGSYTEQKVQQHLEKFFTMRRVFAEHRGDVPEEEEAINATAACAQDEDVMSLQLTELANKPRKPLAKRLFKNMKLAWKSHFGKKHSRKNKDGSKEKEEEDMIEEEIGESTSSASTSFSLSPSQVNEVGQPKGQPLAKTLTDEEQMRHDEVLRAATDTKGETSVPDLAESCSQAFVKTSSPTSMDQTTEVLPINCQKELKKTKADSIQPSNSEKEEDVQETEEVRIPEKTSSSRLSTGSEENVQTASSASSSSATSAIYEEPNMTTSQVVEDVGTLESKSKKPAKKKLFKKLKTAWKKHFGKNISPVPQSHEPTPEVRFAEAEDNWILRAATDTEGEVSIWQTVVLAPLRKSPVQLPWIKQYKCHPLLARKTLKRLMLMDRQWREVSEGVYNRGVKDKLIDLCVDVLNFIADSVIKIILESIGQLSTTSCISILKYPISSEHLLEIFNCDIQRSLENSFSRAVCNTIGADIPASISPEFTEGITTEAFVLVNPVLSMAIQASMDQGSSRAIAPARSQVAKDRAAKTLAGAISTMKSILTGRGNAVKKRIMTQKASETNNEEETPGTTRGGNNWKTEPVWRCFSARQRRQVIPVPLQDLNGSSSSPQSKKKSRSPLATSSTTEDPPQNKATTDEVCNIISKTEKKNEEKTRKTKQPLWMRLFCCCCSFEE